MARTINTSVTGPVVIGSGDSPLNITSTGSVTSTGPGEDGIDQGPASIVTVDNAGEIASSDGTGVSLRVGFIANTGSISGIDGVFFAGGDPGDVKNAAGGTISGFGADGFGVYAAGSFNVVTNDGTISGGATGVAINHGRVSNTGSILGSKNGVFIQSVNVGDPLTNSGTISATATDGVGVDVDRGNITNDADGAISGGAFGVLVERGFGTVANAGSIAGDYGVALEAGGSVNNLAGASISGQTAGAFFIGGAGTLTNSGTISATATGGAGVDLEGGGSVTNNAGGSISGGAYGVFIEGGVVNTITNAGTISGGTYAVFFSGNTTNRLVVDPGAMFDGAVNGGGGTLELATGTGSTGGIGPGSAFDNFGNLVVDGGATWTLNGSNIASFLRDDGTLAIAGSLDVSRAIDPSSTGLFQLGDGATLEVAAAAGTLTRINFLGSSELLIDDAASFGINVGTSSYAGTQLQNFVAGDTIDLKNFSSTGVTVNFDPATGVLQVSNDASQVASLDFQTSSLGSDAFQATGDGATGIFITNAPSTTGTAALPSTGHADAVLALFNQFVAAGFHHEQSGIGHIASMPQIQNGFGDPAVLANPHFSA